MRKIIFPYKFGSASGKLIRSTLPAVRVRDTGRYHKRRDDFIINWGNTTLPSFGEADLNKTTAVAKSVDKILTMQELTEREVRTVEWTKDKAVAEQWLAEGKTVYARTLTRAKGGQGIVIVKQGDECPNAKLYTKGIENGTEYRLHVFRGEVIDYTKKVPLRENPNALVKSHDNGWTFARNVEQRDSLKELAIKAIEALGLDFGAVDIITNPDNKNRAHVLEINSAPGISGRTLENYINKFNSL